MQTMPSYVLTKYYYQNSVHNLAEDIYECGCLEKFRLCDCVRHKFYGGIKNNFKILRKFAFSCTLI